MPRPGCYPGRASGCQVRFLLLPPCTVPQGEAPVLQADRGGFDSLTVHHSAVRSCREVAPRVGAPRGCRFKSDQGLTVQFTHVGCRAQAGLQNQPCGVRVLDDMPWKVKPGWLGSGLETRGTLTGQVFDSPSFLHSTWSSSPTGRGARLNNARFWVRIPGRLPLLGSMPKRRGTCLSSRSKRVQVPSSPPFNMAL